MIAPVVEMLESSAVVIALAVWLVTGVLTVSAALLETRWAEMLNRSVNGPCFRFEHTFYDFENRPLSSGWFICPADKLHFTVHIGHFED